MVGFVQRQLRGLGWRPDLPDRRDFEFRPMAGRIPKEAKLDARYLPPIRDQQELGSCTGHAVTGAMSFIRVRGGQPYINLSPLFAYYNARMLENTVSIDAGAEIRDVVKAAYKWGVCAEEFAKYDTAKFAEKPSSSAYSHAMFDRVIQYSRINGSRLRSIKESIYRQCPVVFGFSVYENFDKVESDGVAPMPQGATIGGHAVWAVGYSDATGLVKCANSWSTEWGDKGYFYLKYSYIEDVNLADDFWAIKIVN
jgi:C1A family cysteine protease